MLMYLWIEAMSSTTIKIIRLKPRELSALQTMHERMLGAIAYVNEHPRTAFGHIALHNVNVYFDAIEALIPQEDA